MNRIVKVIAIAIVIALIALILKTAFYRGIYLPPPTQLHDFNISIEIAETKEFPDLYNVSKRTVLVDLAHDNNFEHREIETLLARLAARGSSIQYLMPDESLEEHLEEASSFIVISPQTPFKAEELEELKKFRGKILLLFDPEKADNRGIAAYFGAIAHHDYLYNLKQNDGNFRYVFFSSFGNSSLTTGLSKITLFTACSISPAEKGLIFADAETYSFEERNAILSPAVLLDNILVLCDLTFLEPPYSLVTDNSLFISNIANWLTS